MKREEFNDLFKTQLKNNKKWTKKMIDDRNDHMRKLFPDNKDEDLSILGPEYTGHRFLFYVVTSKNYTSIRKINTKDFKTHDLHNKMLFVGMAGTDGSMPKFQMK